MYQELNENNGTKQRLLEKAKKVKLKLQMVQWRTDKWKTNEIKLDANKTYQVRRWLVDQQQLYGMALQKITGNWFLKLLCNIIVVNDILRR